ncbi:MAG: MFS transporter [Bacillota bacterium]
MNQRPSGVAAFVLVWVGQLISMLGSGLTSFAVLYWAYELSRSATSLSLLALCSFVPSLLIGPFAGALVDRWNRKLVMMFSDIGAGLSTILLLLLYTTGALEVWHLYVANAFAGVFGSFQWPAYMAAMSMMVPPKHYSRANGMISLASSAMLILSPILAGVLLSWLDMGWILIIDIATFLIAVGLLLAVHIPNPTPSAEGRQHTGPLWQEAMHGFRYVMNRPGLLGLQLVFLLMNLFNNLGQPVRQTMVLIRTNSDPTILASVNSALAFGSLAGSLLMTVWAGFHRKVNGVLLGMILQGVLGSLVFGLGRAPGVWMTAAFLLQLFMVMLQTSANAIWQSQVPLDLQGRVMATRRLIAHSAIPIGMGLSGPLADRVFEPAMAPGGALAPLFGGLVGTGPGSGMALMLVLAGLLSALAGLGGFLYRPVRELEGALPARQELPVEARAETGGG